MEYTIWKTGVRTTGAGRLLSELTVWGGYADSLITRDKKPHGTLTGTRVKSPKIFVGYFNDWRFGLEDYAKTNRLAEPRYIFGWKKPTSFGWNSWGAIQTKDAFRSISDTRYTLNSTNYGWWQTYLYNFIDADHIVFLHGIGGRKPCPAYVGGGNRHTHYRRQLCYVGSVGRTYQNVTAKSGDSCHCQRRCCFSPR